MSDPVGTTILRHAERLNKLLAGYIVWSVLCGEPDSARTMGAMRLIFGEWIENAWRPSVRAVYGVSGVRLGLASGVRLGLSRPL